MIREISAEGMRYLYLTPATRPSQISDPAYRVARVDPYMETLPGIDRWLRVALIQILPGQAYAVFYLFWPSGADLASLDEKVVREAYGDADFTGALATEYQRTKCSQCGRRWHTLVFRADPYAMARGLFEKKGRLVAYRPCPHCGAALRQPVVCVFGQVSTTDAPAHRTQPA